MEWSDGVTLAEVAASVALFAVTLAYCLELLLFSPAGVCCIGSAVVLRLWFSPTYRFGATKNRKDNQTRPDQTRLDQTTPGQPTSASE